MSHWAHILTPAELEAQYALTASLDPSFARQQREFYETRSDNDLRALMHQAWLCNEACRYQLIRSHLALRAA